MNALFKVSRIYIGRMKRGLTGDGATVRKWEAAGSPVPPPHPIKQSIVREYALRYNLGVLVETGTYLGDMVFAMRNQFKLVESIELDENLFRLATLQFRPWSHIRIHHGDSAKFLPKILSTLYCPALFWLDGHYSGGITAKGDKTSPILDELAAIARHPVPGHVILIDDARLFTGEDGYPSEDQFRSFVGDNFPARDIFVKDDVFRIVTAL